MKKRKKAAEKYEKKYPVLIKRYFNTKDDHLLWVVKHTNHPWQLWKSAKGSYVDYADSGHSVSQ